MVDVKTTAAPMRIKESKGDRVFLLFVYLTLAVVLVAVAYPLIYVISASFSSINAVRSGRVWLWPVEPTLIGYQTVFEHSRVMNGYANSAFYTFFGTLVNVAMTVMIAYPLSRRDFWGRRFIMVALVFTMMFYGGLIPTYLVVLKLGMVNTRWAMIIPQALTVWHVIVARTFFRASIPSELVDQASIDGCSDFYFIYSVVLPLSKPIIAVMSLIYAVFHWNAYFHAMIYLNSTDLYPLQLVLRELLILNQSERISMVASAELAREGLNDLLKYSLIVVGSLPMFVLYPISQKHDNLGILIGSLK